MNTNTFKDDYTSELKSSQKKYNTVVKLLPEGVCLYGYGFIGRWAYDFLKRKGAKISFITDNDPHKLGFSVSNDNIVSGKTADYSKIKAVLVCSRHAVKAIENELSYLEVPVMSIDSFVCHEFVDRYLSTLEYFFRSDEKSLDTLYCVLRSMLSGDYSHLSPVVSCDSLFSLSPFFNMDNEVYIDTGAYVGDTFEKFIWSVNGIFKKAYLFEPGTASFCALQARTVRLMREWALSFGQVELINSAVIDVCGSYNYMESNQFSQSTLSNFIDINGQSSCRVNTVSLDEFFRAKDEMPTLIKVDIEGSEANLLQGASKLIMEQKPKLIFSVYHFPSDIFLLPIAIKRLNNRYSFKLRHHSSKLMETILYCS